jgi:hypothetical protein
VSPEKLSREKLSPKNCRLPNCRREKLSPAQKCRQHKNVASTKMSLKNVAIHK